MIIQVIAAFAAIFTFAMALEIPKKYLINCGFIGAAGWFVYLVVLQRFGMMTANLLGAAAITLLAHFFARIKKAPVTIFLIPGFLTLVPVLLLLLPHNHPASYPAQPLLWQLPERSA